MKGKMAVHRLSPFCFCVSIPAQERLRLVYNTQDGTMRYDAERKSPPVFAIFCLCIRTSACRKQVQFVSGRWPTDTDTDSRMVADEG